MTKFLCTLCYTRLTADQVLRAPNPFDPTETLTGCPECKAVHSLAQVCDEPGCWEVNTCGTPTKTAYRETCYKHLPKENE